MAIMKEAKTLTFGDTQYVVVDAEAREKISELEQNINEVLPDPQQQINTHNSDENAHADIRSSISNLNNDKLNKTELSNAINTALDTAKNSGKFNGKDGSDYVLTESDKQEIAELAAQLVDCNIKPTAKTDSMTQPVGVDSEGRLWTDPSVKSGSGISATTANLLIKILKSGQYSEDQTANILALEAALLSGENGEVELPDNGVEQVGNILAISSGVSVSQTESVLIIA